MPDFNPIFPQDWFQTCSEQIKLSDEVTHPYFARLLTADLKFSDTISFIKNLTLTLSENFVLTDSPTSDTIKLLLEEFVALSDENPSISITLDETLKLVDTLETQTGYKKTLSDNIVLSGFLPPPIELELNEVFMLPDTHSLDLIKLLSDNLLLNDEETDVLTKTLSDNLKLSDSYSKEWTLNRDLVDTLKLTDEFSKTWALSRTYTDNLVLGDTVVASTVIDWVITLSDSLKLSDLFSSLVIDYTLTLTENLVLKDYQFGNPDETNVYVYDEVTAKWILVEGIQFFKIEKRLNQMSKFSITMPQIETAQKLYVKEFAKVLMISNQFLILKGRIQKVTYQTTSSCEVEGFGMEAVILDKEYQNATISPTDPDRVQYNNTSAQLIAKELLSVDSDGIAPWIMEPRTYGLFLNDYGPTSVRYEFANTLTALGNLSNAINYDWWVDQTPLTYANDYFNIATIKGNQTNPLLDPNRQFTISGPNVNAEGTDYQRDVTNVANFVKIQGYGDGINQVYTFTYNASPIWTILSANVLVGDVTISLLDSSSFPAAGTVRIAEEVITYTGNVGNQLTGCTRGTSGTTALPHGSGCYIEKYVDLNINPPEAGSSMAEYGTMDLTETFREVIDLSTLELIASYELINRMAPIERINIIPTDPNLVAETIQTGDLVSIIDAESGLNSNYRIVTIIYEFNYGNLSITLEVSNKSLTFIEQMQKEREKNQALQKYMQGSTNIYCVNQAENCDPTHPLKTRFYIPPEAIAINHVKINFKMENYRAYESPGTTANSAISGIAAAGTSSSSFPLTSNVWTTVSSITTANTDCEGCFLNAAMDFAGITNWIATGSYGNGGFTWRIVEGANYYPSSGGGQLLGGVLWNSEPQMSGAVSYHVPGNQKNKTFNFQVKWDGFDSGLDWIVNSTLSYATFSRHTHDIVYDIYEDPLVNPVSVTVKVGATTIGTYATDQNNIEITTAVPTAGAWYEVEFTPNQVMRIDGNVYIQIFIQSA
jgi:hypothetical protein